MAFGKWVQLSRLNDHHPRTNFLTKGDDYDAIETGKAFRGAEDRHLEPLKGETVDASGWAVLRQSTFICFVHVFAAYWDCWGRPPALAGP